MDKALNKIKKTWEENPLLVIGIATAAATAASQLMNANAKRINAKAWKKEVNRRSMMHRR